MSDGMNPDQIQAVFSSLGRIEENQRNHGAWMAAHVLEDAKMAADIRQLQLSSARQKGFITALTAIGSAIGAGIGVLAEYFHTK